MAAMLDNQVARLERNARWELLQNRYILEASVLLPSCVLGAEIRMRCLLWLVVP